MVLFLKESDEEFKTEVFSNCSPLICTEFEAVGRWFEACLTRQRSDKSFSQSHDINGDEESNDEEESGEEKELTEELKEYLFSLDAAEWKKQDHYKVLNVEEVRGKASDDDIKKAYRRMVLRFHPDKKNKNIASPLPKGTNEQNLFSCITKAYEQLSTLKGRQAYDSVDEMFDDDVPSYNSNSKQDFFKVFKPVFERNSRWSIHQPVPSIGNKNTSQDDVNSFYSFWYEFRSWRNFSYLDEEDKDKAENREERRWIERENKAMRQKKKKEEMARIRNLVDTAYQNDPRLKKFKEEERQKKLELKLAKEQAAQEKEKERLEELEKQRKIKEQQEQEAKEKAQREKKEKDKIKKAAAKDRKVIRQAVKAAKYFDSDKNEVDAIHRLEKLMENLSLQSIQELKEHVEEEEHELLREKYIQYSNDVLEKLEKQLEEKRQKEEAAAASAKAATKNANAVTSGNWNEVELQLLVKATTLFPVGTASRWDVIASYINEHSGSSNEKTGKQVISKVKNLKKLDPSHKEEVNRQAFQNLEKANANKQMQINAQPSQKDQGNMSVPWTSDEQKLLEEALKTYNSSTPERWDKIAELIPSRTKKECMKRYKELVEMVKAKKAAAGTK